MPATPRPSGKTRKPAQSRPTSKAGSAVTTRKPAAKARKPAASTQARAARPQPAYVVRHSPIHGRGVFASRTIRKGANVIEYRGRRISMEQADDLPDSDPDNPFHTFLFELNDGRVIDAGLRGNAARWINHSCQPNCEPYEDDDCRVFIAAKRTIEAGEELAYDYKLNVPGRRTPRLLANYACRCGAPRCRGTMVDVKKKT
jgi:SET domain-containing protein